jgi:hypothetical protein
VYAEQFTTSEQAQQSPVSVSGSKDETSQGEYPTASTQHVASLEHAYNACSHNLRIIQQRYLKTAQNYHALHRQYCDLYQDSQYDRKKLELQKGLIVQLEAVIDVYRTGYLSLPSVSDHESSSGGVAEPVHGPSALMTTTSTLPQTPVIMPLAEPPAHRTGGLMAAGAIHNNPVYPAVAGSGMAHYPSSSLAGTSSPPKPLAKHRTNAGVSKRGRKNGKPRQQSLEVLAASQMAVEE